MNNQPIPTGIEQVKPLDQIPVQKPPRIVIPARIKEIWSKFYSNKKIFWPVSISLGLFLLVLLTGLLFGTRNRVARPTTPFPTPAVSVTPVPTNPDDILTITNVKLLELDAEIKELDVRQSRLAPPSVNFDIRF